LNPFISVIINVYNHAHILPKVFEALKAQTFKDFEIVIIDDCSPDNSREIIDDFCKKNDTLNVKKIYLEKNLGVCGARNVGLDTASGIYIIYNDGDEWMEDNCLEELANIAKQYNADRVKGDYRRVDFEKGKTIDVRVFNDKMSKWAFPSFVATIYRREIFESNNIRCQKEYFLEDLYISGMFAVYEKSYAVCNKIIYNSMKTASSMTSSDTWKFLPVIDNAFSVYSYMKTMINSEEMDCFNYNYISYYYFVLAKFGRQSLKNAIKNHKYARQLIRKKIPDYLKNPLITFRYNPYFAKGGQKLIWGLALGEKLRIIPLSWIAYIILSKIINPDT